MMLVNIVYNFYFVILILIFGKETKTVKTDKKKKNCKENKNEACWVALGQVWICTLVIQKKGRGETLLSKLLFNFSI